MPPDEQRALIAQSPSSADDFVDAVVIAEGRDPLTLDSHERRDLVECVRDWLFDDGKGKGSKSGLPFA